MIYIQHNVVKYKNSVPTLQTQLSKLIHNYIYLDIILKFKAQMLFTIKITIIKPEGNNVVKICSPKQLLPQSQWTVSPLSVGGRMIMEK